MWTSLQIYSDVLSSLVSHDTMIIMNTFMCVQHLQQTDIAEYTGPKAFCCALEGCSHRELTPIACDHCHLNFCLRYFFFASAQKGSYKTTTTNSLTACLIVFVVTACFIMSHFCIYIFFNPFITDVAEQWLVLRTPLLPSNTIVAEQWLVMRMPVSPISDLGQQSY